MSLNFGKRERTPQDSQQDIRPVLLGSTISRGVNVRPEFLTRVAVLLGERGTGIRNWGLDGADHLLEAASAESGSEYSVRRIDVLRRHWGERRSGI